MLHSGPDVDVRGATSLVELTETNGAITCKLVGWRVESLSQFT